MLSLTPNNNNKRSNHPYYYHPTSSPPVQSSSSSLSTEGRINTRMDIDTDTDDGSSSDETEWKRSTRGGGNNNNNSNIVIINKRSGNNNDNETMTVPIRHHHSHHPHQLGHDITSRRNTHQKCYYGETILRIMYSALIVASSIMFILSIVVWNDQLLFSSYVYYFIFAVIHSVWMTIIFVHVFVKLLWEGMDWDHYFDSSHRTLFPPWQNQWPSILLTLIISYLGLVIYTVLYVTKHEWNTTVCTAKWFEIIALALYQLPAYQFISEGILSAVVRSKFHEEYSLV